MIRTYTREAGVRNLEREISKLARKALTRIVRKDVSKVEITPEGVRITAAKVDIAGKDAVTVKSKISNSNGDEAGTLKGMMSQVNMNSTSYRTGSSRVKCQGNAIVTVKAPAGQIVVATVRAASFAAAGGGGNATISN